MPIAEARQAFLGRRERAAHRLCRIRSTHHPKLEAHLQAWAPKGGCPDRCSACAWRCLHVLRLLRISEEHRHNPLFPRLVTCPDCGLPLQRPKHGNLGDFPCPLAPEGHWKCGRQVHFLLADGSPCHTDCPACVALASHTNGDP